MKKTTENNYVTFEQASTITGLSEERIFKVVKYAKVPTRTMVDIDTLREWCELPEKSKKNNYVTFEQASTITGLSKYKIFNVVKCGDIPTRAMIDIDALQEWCELPEKSKKNRCIVKNEEFRFLLRIQVWIFISMFLKVIIPSLFLGAVDDYTLLKLFLVNGLLLLIFYYLLKIAYDHIFIYKSQMKIRMPEPLVFLIASFLMGGYVLMIWGRVLAQYLN